MSLFQEMRMSTVGWPVLRGLLLIINTSIYYDADGDLGQKPKAHRGTNQADREATKREIVFVNIFELAHENDFALMEVIAGYLFQTEKEYGEVRKNLTT